MTASVVTGPNITAGSLFSTTGAPEYNPDAGPGISYMGDGLPDVRVPIMKDWLDRGGVVPGHLNNPYFVIVDGTPQAVSSTNIVNAQAGTAVSLPLNTTFGADKSANIPIIPFLSGYGNQAGGSNTPKLVTALDFGFTTGNATSGSATIASIPALAVQTMYVGQWLVIAAGLTATTPLITMVTSIASTTSVTVSPAPTNTQAGVQIGSANLYNNLWGGTASAAWPYQGIGPAAMLDPRQTISRAVSVTSTAGATATTCTIAGYDVYGQAMSEAITVVAGGTAYGKKAFKYIASATLNATDAGHSYSVGTADCFGFPIRSDAYEYMNMYYNQTFLVATGWLAATITSPATTTTGDVRGTLSIGTLNNAGAGAAGGASNGTRRLTIAGTIPLANLVAGNPQQPYMIYGVTQA